MQEFQAHLLVHNIGKAKNIGTMIRNAAAFNVSKVYFIGKQQSQKKKFKVVENMSFFGNHGTLDQMDIEVFPSLKAAKEHFVQQGLFVCGIEICEGAQSIATHPFRGNTVFFMGNEGTGLIPEHKAICDHFVYIPQYTHKTASLNVSVASGIIFHHFAIWAKFKEVEIFGEKFQDQTVERQKEKEVKLTQLKAEKQLEREEKKQREPEEEGVQNLFE